MKKFVLFCLPLLLMVFTSDCAEEQKNPILGHQKMAPKYLLPQDHWLKPVLDKIFSSRKVLESQKSLDTAGFITLYNQSSGMRVLQHPLLPGFLIKAYLNDENRRSGKDFCWLIDRCIGAENIRDLIKNKRFKYFSVPDKWIYLLPGEPGLNRDRQPGILIVTDMELVSEEKSIVAWKTKITKPHLKELYSILNHGFGSCYLPYNIPCTKKGTFAFVDTIYPKRVHDLRHVRSYLSQEMMEYWNKLIDRGN